MCFSDIPQPCSEGECFKNEMRCGYYDQKRGMFGTTLSGPITLRVAKGSMYHCVVWVGEPSYGWAKPHTNANWHKELKVEIDGKECEIGSKQVALYILLFGM